MCLIAYTFFSATSNSGVSINFWTVSWCFSLCLMFNHQVQSFLKAFWAIKASKTLREKSYGNDTVIKTRTISDTVFDFKFFTLNFVSMDLINNPCFKNYHIFTNWNLVYFLFELCGYVTKYFSFLFYLKINIFEFKIIRKFYCW